MASLLSLPKLLLRRSSPALSRSFSSSRSSMSTSFNEAVKARRSIYALSASSPISDAAITTIVNEAVKHSPSSFNSQSSRAILLLGEEHTKMWSFAKDAIKAIVPAEAYPASEARLNGFQGAYGTVLLFEDRDTVAGLQKNIVAYADKFPQWADHASGILAFVLWTGLEDAGLGANLQHYNPLIDAAIMKEWGIPESWELKAQLVFGKIEAAAGPKEFAPLEDRVKVFGAKA